MVLSQSTIFAYELKASELETPRQKTTQLQPRPRPVVEVTPHTSETLTADAYRVEEVCQGASGHPFLQNGAART